MPKVLYTENFGHSPKFQVPAATIPWGSNGYRKGRQCSEPKVKEMEADDALGAMEGNGKYIHPVELQKSRQISRRKVRALRTLSPQMRGQMHEYSGVFGQRWPLQFVQW